MAKPRPDVIRICKICGDEYHPNSSRQMTCNKPKDHICPICGKTYQVVCKPNAGGVACSPECIEQVIIRKRTASAAKLIKVCKACGKSFTPKTVMDVFCSGPHYRNCVVCGKQFEYNPKRKDAPHTCSKECRYKLALDNRDTEAAVLAQKQSLMRKYGVENVMGIPGVREKQKKTIFERYGGWYTQTEDYRKKTTETDLRKYGVDHHMRSPELIQKRIDKLVAERGVVNVFQLPEIKEKSKETLRKNYGVDYISQSEEIKNKITETNFRRYGAKHAMQLEEFKEKARETSRKLYGRDYKMQMRISDIDAWYSFIRDPRAYISEHYAEPPRTEAIAKDLGVDFSTVSDYLKKFNASDCVSRSRSLMEDSIHEFIKSIDPSIRIIHNDKTAIRPYELDFYMPDYNFAIECDPTCTHNSSFVDPWGSNPKSITYHQIKTNLCDDAGIFLFHVFGYEWTNNRDIIFSMITNILGKNPIRIYARKCSVRTVSSKDARRFLNENHRQGNTNSQIRLGLYEGERLVSVMTFGKFRSTIGTGNEDLSDCWELSRFCSLKYTTVIGAAEKLFSYFIKNYNPIRVRSFSDRSHTRGTLYGNLGFTEVRRSAPNYVWVDVKTDIGYHRYSAQKKNLVRFLRDDSIDLSKTEKEIMEEHKFAQVYDSGTITWEWKRS